MTIFLRDLVCTFTTPVKPCIVSASWDSVVEELTAVRTVSFMSEVIAVEGLRDLLNVVLRYNIIVSAGRDTTYTTDVLLDLVRERKDTVTRALAEVIQRGLGLDYVDALDRALKLIYSLGVVDVTSRDSSTLPEQVLTIERSVRLRLRASVREDSEVIEVEVTRNTVRDVVLLVLYKLFSDAPRELIVHGKRATCIITEGRKVKLAV